jgi:predicted transcriptional regulator of viral defense system
MDSIAHMEVNRMDKRKVITAYRRGFITIQECAQILGIDSIQIMGLMSESEMPVNETKLKQQPMHG